MDFSVERLPWGKMSMFDVPGEIIRSTEPYHNHENWYKSEPFASTIFYEKYTQLLKYSDEFFIRHGYERQGGRFRCIKPNRDQIAVFCHLSRLSMFLELPPTLVWSGFGWHRARSPLFFLMRDQTNGQYLDA